MFMFKVDLSLEKLIIPSVLFNILFLSLIASALCFITRNIGVSFIGAIKASNYIYIVPLITTVTSVIVLKEPVTNIVLLGAGLILLGLYISQNGFKNPFKYLTLIIKRLKRITMYETK